MNPTRQPASIDLMDYARTLRRHWLIVIAFLLVGVLGGVAYVEVVPKTWTATAAVDVLRTGANQTDEVKGARAGGAIDLDSEAQLVTSLAVATAAGTLMRSTISPTTLSNQVHVTVPPNSGILDIACGTRSRAAAAVCANAFAHAYIANRSAAAVATIDSQLGSLHSRVTTLQKTISTLYGQISTLPANDLTRGADEADLKSDRAAITNLSRQIAKLTGENASTTGGTITTAATPPAKPSNPDKTLVLPSALVSGLLLGLILAFVWDRRDKRLHSAEDVERLLDIPVMLDLPRKSFGRQVSLASPRSRMGKAFTELAHTVAASLGEGSHVLLVAGTSPGPEASVVAANLAATLARTHSEAVLVCGDLQDSVATEMFGLSDSRGLSEVVAGRATVGEVARGPAGIPGLWVIPPGADTSLAEYHLQYDTAKALTTQLRRDARYVVIEAQATDDGADTFALAEFADAALLTIDIDHTSRQEAGTCVKRLHRMRTPILGAVTMPTLGNSVFGRPAQAAASGALSNRPAGR